MTLDEAKQREFMFRYRYEQELEAEEAERDANAAKVDAEMAARRGMTPREEWKETLRNKPTSNLKVGLDIVPGAIRDTVNLGMQWPRQLSNLHVAGARGLGKLAGVPDQYLPEIPFSEEDMPSVEKGARAIGLQDTPLDFIAGIDPEMENMSPAQRMVNTAGKTAFSSVLPARGLLGGLRNAGVGGASGAIMEGVGEKYGPVAGLLSALTVPTIAAAPGVIGGGLFNKVADVLARANPTKPWAVSHETKRLGKELWNVVPADEKPLILAALKAGGEELAPGATPTAAQIIAGAQTSKTKFGDAIMQFNKQVENTAGARLTESQQTEAIEKLVSDLAGGNRAARNQKMVDLKTQQRDTTMPMFDKAAELANTGNVEMAHVENVADRINDTTRGLLNRANADMRAVDQEVATQIPLLDQQVPPLEARRINALKQSGQMQAAELAARNAANKAPVFPPRGLLDVVEAVDAQRPPGRPRGLLTEETGTSTTRPIMGQFPAHQQSTVPGPLPATRANVDVIDNLPNVPRRYSPQAEADLTLAESAAKARDEFDAAVRAADEEIASLRKQKEGLLDTQARTREGVAATGRTAAYLDAQGRTILSNKLDELAARGIAPMKSGSLIAHLEHRMEIPDNLPDGDVESILSGIRGELTKATDSKTGRIDAASLLRIRAKANEKIENLLGGKPGWNDRYAAQEVKDFKDQIDLAFFRAGGEKAADALKAAIDKHRYFQNLKSAQTVKGALRDALVSSKSDADQAALSPSTRFLAATDFEGDGGAKFLKGLGINPNFHTMESLLDPSEFESVMNLRKHFLRNETLARGAKGGSRVEVPNVQTPIPNWIFAYPNRKLQGNRPIAQALAEAEAAKRMQTPKGLLGMIPGRDAPGYYNPSLVPPLLTQGVPPVTTALAWDQEDPYNTARTVGY